MSASSLYPLLLGDALLGDIVQAPSVKLTVLDTVCSGLAGHPLCILFLLRQGALKQVGLEYLGLAPLLRLEHEEHTGPRSRATGWGAHGGCRGQLLPRQHRLGNGGGAADGLKSHSSKTPGS